MKPEQLIKTELQSQRQLEKLNSEGWRLVVATQRAGGQPYLVFEKDHMASRDHAPNTCAAPLASELAGQERSRIERLVRALEPFEDIAGEGDEDFPDDTPVTVKFGRTTHYALKLSDLRNVRAALEPTDQVPPETEDGQ